MRLIDTHTLQLVECFGPEFPTYVILSHVWGNDEVTYQEMRAGISREQLEQREGGRKILCFCHRAAYYGYRLAWIDTCCIDKTSSAELSESINSMYRWYAQADVCWAFMSDVRIIPVVDYLTANMNLNDRYREPFLASRWHTRGWTLQELLAPSDVRFLDMYWFEFGTRTSLALLVTQVTRISEIFLDGPLNATLAQRMSWATRRETTRDEDLIYCLFGLLEVNLPILYGEGRIKAFRRLQRELVDTSDDASLLTWKNVLYQSQIDAGISRELTNFGTCVNVFLIGMPGSETFAMTKRGLYMTGFKGSYVSKNDPAHLKMQPFLEELGYPTEGRLLILPLNCQCGPHATLMEQLCLVLLELAENDFARVSCRKLKKPLDAQSVISIPPFYILRYGFMGPEYVYFPRTRAALGNFGTDDRYDVWDDCTPSESDDEHSEQESQRDDKEG